MNLEPVPQTMLNVLALNSGSSSLKFGLYRVGSSQADLLLSGEAEASGDNQGSRIASLLAEFGELRAPALFPIIFTL